MYYYIDLFSRMCYIYSNDIYLSYSSYRGYARFQFSGQTARQDRNGECTECFLSSGLRNCPLLLLALTVDPRLTSIPQRFQFTVANRHQPFKGLSVNALEEGKIRGQV